MALSPLPLMLAFTGAESLPAGWRLGMGSLGSLACFLCAVTLFRRPGVGRVSGWVALAVAYGTAFPYISTTPFGALGGSVLGMGMGHLLLEFRIHVLESQKCMQVDRCLQRARWATFTVPGLVVFGTILNLNDSFFPAVMMVLSSVIAQVLFGHWAWVKGLKKGMVLSGAGILFSMGNLWFYGSQLVPTLAVFISLLTFFFLPRDPAGGERHDPWWELLLNHPARLMLTTFFLLCFLGTLLLLVPGSTKVGTIGLVDAAFTSVSAVCVTGLIVLDTPHDFTGLGQFFILVLIQFGGLGIMSITTVALHAMGRRLSLKQERLMTSITDTDHQDLMASLATILKVTFLSEGFGAAILGALFWVSGDSFLTGVWRGVFTAISAFCNAGFALQPDSLIPYQNQPLILHTVSTLIILGGMAPATSLIIPRWVRGKQVSIPARITLVTTAVLLFAGMFFVLAFEWNGVLAGLSGWNKLQNAWFQSVTLRTAGFNSIDIAQVANPTFLVMICLMFIGGSPGGTAGGVKTTTLGILAMTFWASITNRNGVITHHRRIPPGTIYRAVTIVSSGLFVWFLVVLMLEVTQQISAKNLIFEATSALGTVGLSTGATLLLDEIGKLIIMIAMFAGRIGPITLFMFLSDDQATSVSPCPDVKISLT